jgi:hypothetical protein
MNLRTLAVVGLLLLLPVAARAEGHQCACCAKGGHGERTAAQTPAPTGALSAAPAYDAEYEGLFAGVIYSVMRHSGMDVQLTIGVGEKSFDVLVAPMNWLDSKHVVFRTGERVEIVGARADRGSGDTIVAREIHTADQTIVLRNTAGQPLWN